MKTEKQEADIVEAKVVVGERTVIEAKCTQKSTTRA
jgi:hypothetical protein